MQLRGLAVSPGIAVGRALVLKHHVFDVRFRVPADAVTREIERLGQARERSRRQLEAIRARVGQSAGAQHASMFEAQLLMLDDPLLTGRAAELIGDERLNAEWAVRRASGELAARFERLDDPYLRERKADVADVSGRLCLNLRPVSGVPTDLVRSLEGPLVLVADELAPSMAAQIDWRLIVGFVTDVGSWTYHTAILARSLHVPAVVGLHNASGRIPPGAMLALDGSSGEVLVDPPAEVLRQFDARRGQQADFDRALTEYRRVPAVTHDGVRIRLEANVELPEELATVRESGAEGIGLYRSEFLLIPGMLHTLTAVDEDGQYRIYRTMLEQMAPAPVTIRTFDVAERDLYPEADNGEPAARGGLGLRGIRLSLTHRGLFRAQLRALLRAARHGRLRIMFPFVTGLEEILAARAVVSEVAAELASRGEPPPPVPVGVMIEVPSAALTADLLAQHADFFSIGTNDLIQCCLAIDRTDDRVSRLYEPLHPAVLRLLRHVSRSARRRGIPLSLCGEMAADPAVLALLIGLGFCEFSMAPTMIPLAKRAVRSLRADEARHMAARALRGATVEEIRQALGGADLGGRPKPVLRRA